MTLQYITLHHITYAALAGASLSQVAALVFGDESAALSQPVGYRGEHTLSMRSTKVGGCFCLVRNVGGARHGCAAAAVLREDSYNWVLALSCMV